ncbi:ATP-binding cassette domain-containing protein [Belliella kenyensis]|uniref:ATP-binding cassette domain-containing protein n=1 Tax=Belliella kenyensis TaxID=1472724 RepID=A0ABV8EJV4_9BACT|nr:ABC transporter ATP-binding protein [Belliella kenyensis]MCH7402774.1 ABC transporter ATP-binding protein [Belliella kenyensis]MDN3603677.1 ABC transporter ATP-binding protein [Belliella kenyensis]
MVTIEKMDFSYPKKPLICRGLNLFLEQGKIIGLLGLNGAGKSTLMRLMAGLLKPKTGAVKFDNHATFERTVTFLNQMVFIPEKVSVPEFLKVKDYLSVYKDFYEGFDTGRLEELFVEFKITGNQRISNLSFGQQKKLQIAIGLSSGAKLLLFDEPTNGLDIPSKSTFRKVLSGSLQEDQTMVISTHQVKDIENLVDQVIVLDQGMIKLHADLAELENEFVFSQATKAPEGAIYVESHLLGAHYIIGQSESVGDSGGSPDLELLFNAVIEGKISGEFLTNQKLVKP